MPSQLAGHSAKIRRLAALHEQDIDTFVQMRCTEDTQLDAVLMKTACRGYIEWTAMAAEAAVSHLDKRGWSGLKELLELLVMEHHTHALEHPTESSRKVPSLLSYAFFFNDFLHRLSNSEVQFITADLNTAAQNGLSLLGEADAQAIDESVRTLTPGASMVLVNDIVTVGAAYQSVPPETVPPLELLMSGGRVLSPHERAIAGSWVYEEYYSSGHVELHMILAGDGRCARTARSVASLTFYSSTGDWAGFMNAMSSVRPEDRGSWSYAGGLLTLSMDDDSVYEYEATTHGASMITRNTADGQKRLWSREAGA